MVLWDVATGGVLSRLSDSFSVRDHLLSSREMQQRRAAGGTGAGAVAEIQVCGGDAAEMGSRRDGGGSGSGSAGVRGEAFTWVDLGDA